MLAMLKSKRVKAENVDARHWVALDQVLQAKSLQEAEDLAKKAVDKLYIHLLVRRRMHSEGEIE